MQRCPRAIERITIPWEFEVPVSIAGAEDWIALDVVMEVAINEDEEDVWLEGLRRKDGGAVSQLDALFLTAEAWVDDMAGAILNKEYH